ncbi:MAG: hypothetical protein M9949_08565 [Candidatus Kapabacteria bacterium]|nr:hypothetical protein [Candidatus Kapabacteria bacterium]
MDDALRITGLLAIVSFIILSWVGIVVVVKSGKLFGNMSLTLDIKR